jgi:outer membrane protein OmpA-like peptidoglycan-associated protein
MRVPMSLAAMLAALLFPLAADAAMTSMRAPLFGSTDEAKARADAVDARMLAPLGYAEAMSNYDRADATFERAGSVDSIRRYLTKAEAQFNQATEAATLATSALDSTIQARRDALAADAPNYAERDWDDGESAFAEATRRLERGSMKYADRYAEKAEAAYRAGELAAIKVNYLSETETLIEEAEDLRAERYAPRSLNNARLLLESAESALNEDRYDTDKPRSLAADAKHNARHAIYVSLLEKRIRDRDTTLEEVLLGWEASIARLGDALDTPVYFDEGETEAVQTLLAALAEQESSSQALTSKLADREEALEALNGQIARLEALVGGGNQTIEELETMLAEHKRSLEQQERHRARFAAVEGLFEPAQASVLRQGDTVIIRMVGLNFDSGAARIKPEHREILNRLEAAIAEFPESRVVVEGHTDAFGSDAQNLNLSQARADAVVRHLLGTLPISPADLNAMGYGESRPVANNETEEGRRRNRRIDVVIKPLWVNAGEVARVEVPDIVLHGSN